MNNRYLKQTTFMMVLLLVYNYAASVGIGYINKYLPPAYQLDTSGVSALLNDLKANGLQYGMSMVGYFMVYLIFVILLITVVLYHYHQLRIKTWLRNIHRGKIYVWIFVLLLILLPLNQFGMKIPVINYIPIPETFVSMISGTGIKIFAGIVYLGILLIVFRLKNTMYYLIVKDYTLKHAITKSWHKNKHQLLTSITLILWLIGYLLLAVGILMGLQYLIDYVGNLDISIMVANVFIACLTGTLYFVTAQLLLMFMTELTIQIDQKPGAGMQLLAVIAMVATGGLSVSLANRFM